MKRFIVTVMAIVSAVSLSAQGVIVVDSEKIFRSLDEYNAALAEIEAMSESYQVLIDAKFADIERLFNEYAATRAQYSTTARQSIETTILEREQAATKLQEEYFSSDGVVMKRRVELIAPIQKRVFAAIDEYAKSQGVDMVIDKASNPSMLYVSSAVDHTQGVIDELKQ